MPASAFYSAGIGKTDASHISVRTLQFYLLLHKFMIVFSSVVTPLPLFKGKITVHNIFSDICVLLKIIICNALWAGDQEKYFSQEEKDDLTLNLVWVSKTGRLKTG